MLKRSKSWGAGGVPKCLASSNGAITLESSDNGGSDIEMAAGFPAMGEESGKKIRDYAEVAYLTGRNRVVASHFPTALGIDDFLHRLEIALYAYGFHGDNSIGKGRKSLLDSAFLTSSFDVNFFPACVIQMV